jgi:hypothetical protein
MLDDQNDTIRKTKQELTTMKEESQHQIQQLQQKLTKRQDELDSEYRESERLERLVGLAISVPHRKYISFS